MKFIIIFISSSFFFQGCKSITEEEGKTAKVKIEVKNSSTKDVHIFLYYPNNLLFKDSIIKSFDSVIVEEGFIHPAPGGPSYHLTNGLDSAEIIFSDGKKLVQTFGLRGNNDLTHNILQDSHYKYFESLNPEFTRKQFTITENDYLRAK